VTVSRTAASARDIMTPKSAKYNNAACRFVGSFYSLDRLPRDRRPHVAFAGRSNVGKSTLLNRLVGQKNLAKVSSTPGKTQSLNFFLVDERFYYVDLPGYGFARVPRAVREAWARLMEEYLVTSENLAGMVFLLDCRREPTPEDRQLIEWLRARELPTVVVITKVDKVSRDKAKRKAIAVEKQLGVSTVPFSSVTGEGKKELQAAIHHLVAQRL
jgi:GTP-binding protein